MRYLLIIDTVGNLVLADVDNEVRMPIGQPLAPGQRSRVSNAVWSAEGQWTAWSVDSDDPDGVHELRLHDEATDTATVLAESITAFYLCPSPCGRYLSHLSPGPLGLELAVSEVASGELNVIERGQPLFWSWSPDGNGLAVHVENRVLVTDSGGGDVRLLSEDAGAFTTPWWLPGGSVAFVADGRILGGGPDGAITPLVDEASAGRFSIDPDGRRLAHLEDTGVGLRLVVVDLLTREVEEITTRPTAAFFWSPTGHRLAVLVMAAPDQVRWIVHDGSDVVELPPFRPGRAWATAVLPFFEQYAQSHHCWSVDGAHLVASAVDDTGAGVAILQEVEFRGVSAWVPDAELAWWA